MNKIETYLLNCFIILEVVLLILSLLFIVRIEATDELWTFQNINKIYNHFTIYKDSNVITTPLFFYIGYIFLLFSFTSYYFVHRIYGIIIFSLIFFVSYRIIYNLKMNHNLIHAYLSLLLLALFQIITTGANYNYLAVLFYLIGLNLYISNKNSNFKQAIVFLCIFFTKQNIGIYYLLCILITELYLSKDFKKFLLDQIKKLLLIILPCVTFYLIYSHLGIWEAFIDYCFKGVSEFSKENIAFSAEPFDYIVPLSYILLTVFINVTKRKHFASFEDTFFTNINIILIFLITLLLIVYPILNSSHFLMTFPISLIGIFYIFDRLLLSEIFNEYRYSKYSKIICFCVLLMLIIRIGYYYKSHEASTTFVLDKNSHYYLLSMDTALYNVRNDLMTFVKEENQKGNDVIILSYESAIAMVELNQSHGYYDLLFKGNVGSNSIEDIENDILSRKNTKYLIVNDDSLIFEQEFPEIWSFIQDNLQYQGSVSHFLIYKNK